MTNYEANNSSSAPQSNSTGHVWSWLSDRLPPERLEKLDSWIVDDLAHLEASMAHMVTPRSVKRDARYQFTHSQR